MTKVNDEIAAKNKLTKRAFALYTPPFKYQMGYIYDANNEMIADDPDKVVQVRGWGRISYMDEPEALQDTVGDMIAEALTNYWYDHNPNGD